MRQARVTPGSWHSRPNCGTLPARRLGAGSSGAPRAGTASLACLSNLGHGQPPLGAFSPCGGMISCSPPTLNAAPPGCSGSSAFWFPRPAPLRLMDVSPGRLSLRRAGRGRPPAGGGSTPAVHQEPPARRRPAVLRRAALFLVARDGRDACLSYHNHVLSYTPWMLARLDAAGVEDGTGPYPRAPAEMDAFFHRWLDAKEYRRSPTACRCTPTSGFSAHGGRYATTRTCCCCTMPI